MERLFDDTTLLALHRITASRVTGRSSAALPDIPAPSGEGLGIREMEEEPFEVSLRFAPEAATYAAERRWSRDQRCEMHDDGSVTLPIRAHNEAECLSRVLGFADRAQVLAPDWLRREIKKTVYAMTRLYHTPHKPADTAESGGSPAAACSLRLRE